MSAKLTIPNDPFATIQEINVSSPSVVHRKESEQSIAASEDYYSLPNNSSRDFHAAQEPNPSQYTLQRYHTPPSRRRTPRHSRTDLERHPSNGAVSGGAALVGGAEQGEDRKTPMRGFGKRRDSLPVDAPPVPYNEVTTPETIKLRDSVIRRKPVPSSGMDYSYDEERTPTQRDYDGRYAPLARSASTTAARSSMAQQIDREADAPTPGLDDTPYIRFALDQLTRDEEVQRESRRYPGQNSAFPSQRQPYQALPVQYPVQQIHHSPQGQPGYEVVPLQDDDGYESRTSLTPPPRDPRRGTYEHPTVGPSFTALPVPSASQRQLQSYSSNVGEGAPDLFIPVDHSSGLHQTLDFLPGILRPLGFGLFLIYLLICLVLLMVAAIYSLVHTGLWNYGTIGDGRYFVAQYLPTLLGTILLLWLWQIEIALYRTTPFLAMASDNPVTRQHGPGLPLVPQGFLLPESSHWRVPGLKTVAIFLLVAWLQIFTLPLLASSFNVYFFSDAGRWRWLATQGVIWPVIALYLLLLFVGVDLQIWLEKQRTGLLWDPRSLADTIVLLERSNALHGTPDVEPPRLGYWRTAARPNEVFHSYGLANQPARRYSVENGRIRESRAPSEHDPELRFSSQSALESGRRAKHDRASREASEPILGNNRNRFSDTTISADQTRDSALPWFLKPSMALLWPVISVILVLAFLIVSYLSSTRLTVDGFRPRVSNAVNRDGFSATNFLYSFIPALLATLCLLFWVNIDLAYRRLQPLAALVAHDGALAERSLLASYTADLPFAVTASALANGHFRVALFSFVTLIAATLPILAGGCFWALFYVPLQETRVSIHFAAFYALTVFTVIYALAYCLIWPSKAMRELEFPAIDRYNTHHPRSFAMVMLLVRQSKLLDDIAFHAPRSKVELVTRLLSASGPAGIPAWPLSASRHERLVEQHPGPDASREAAESRVSLADSVRGFGRARQQAQAPPASGVHENEKAAGMAMARYSIGRHEGRDGKEFYGIDRVR